MTELGADAVTKLEVESADISGGAGNRILQLNERLYDSFESFIDVAWPSRDGSEYDHEEDEDSLLSQSSSRENSCVKEDLEKEVKVDGESIIDDDLLLLNNVKVEFFILYFYCSVLSNCVWTSACILKPHTFYECRLLTTPQVGAPRRQEKIWLMHCIDALMTCKVCTHFSCSYLI